MSKINRILLCLVLAILLSTVAACAQDTPTGLPPSETSQQAPATTSAPPQSDKPFTHEGDVLPLIRAGSTIGDVITLVNAQSVGWVYEGEATGESHLILRNGENYVMLAFIAPEGSILEASEDDNQPLDVLPQELLQEEAIISGAMWADNSFALPLIRGVGVGAQEDDVLRAFLCIDPQGAIIYGIDALNPLADESWASQFVGARKGQYEYSEEPLQVIEYVWSDLTNEDEWRIYFDLLYEIEDAKVKAIYLIYGTDPE